MANETPPETMDVDLPGGNKATLPKDLALKVIAARDTDKKTLRDMSEELGALKAAKDAETAKAAKAEQDRLAIEHAKKGEVDQVRELLTKENKATVDKLAAKYRDVHLEALVARSPKLLKLATDAEQQQLVRDVVAQLRSSCLFNLEQDTLQVIGADGRPALASDGKPKSADAYLEEYLDARSHLRVPTTSSGSGAAGSGKGAAVVGTIKQSQYDHKNAEQARALAAGKLKIVDG